MNIPEDKPQPTPPPSLNPGHLIDEPPPVTPEQRAADFKKRFVWRHQEITFSIASESYYRDLRVTMNAPPLGDYQTTNDYAPEAARVIYCSSLTAQQIRALRLMSPIVQIEMFDHWQNQNIHFHELDAAADLAKDISEAINRARTQPMQSEGDDIDSMGN